MKWNKLEARELTKEEQEIYTYDSIWDGRKHKNVSYYLSYTNGRRLKMKVGSLIGKMMMRRNIL